MGNLYYNKMLIQNYKYICILLVSICILQNKAAIFLF